MSEVINGQTKLRDSVEKVTLSNAIQIRSKVLGDSEIKDRLKEIVQLALAYIPHDRLESLSEATAIASFLSDAISNSMHVDFMYQATVKQFALRKEQV